MGRIFLRRLLIGFGSLGTTPTSSCLGQLRGGKGSSRPTGQSWPSGLISRPMGIADGSRSGTGVFTEVVLPVGAARGIASGRGRGSGWARLHFNQTDPVEVELAADLQKSALAHVAESSCGKYTGQFNMFVAWCDARAEPRETLPASDGTVALYLQSVMNNANTFAPVKAASAAIAFYQKINLFDHEPTQSPAPCLVRGAATKKFGLNTKNRKEPHSSGIKS